jgi:ADP-ribosyl-[dinitrogen reductase] hydrolase
MANANAGGENCHRGAVLGSLLGAAIGEKGIPGDLIAGLHAHNDIKKEIDGFVDAVCTTPKSLP